MVLLVLVAKNQKVFKRSMLSFGNGAGFFIVNRMSLVYYIPMMK